MDTLSRRELLDLWRLKTGRTPMKRPSYVQPCANPVTPSEGKATKYHLTQSLSVSQRKMTAERRGENAATTVTKGTRRRPLQSQGVATPLNDATNQTRNGSISQAAGKWIGSAERAHMKEVFQRDIDSTIAEILAYEPPSDDEGISKALQSEFEESELCGHEVEESSAQNRKKLHKRRSSAYYVDSNLAFESSKICYTTVASEHKRRRSRRSLRVTPESKCLYLTPVKRSTRRKSRSICCPVEMLFDSPTEARGQEGCEGVKVLPNQALAVTTPLHNTATS